MLLAALRAARVPPALREALATLAKVPPSGDDVAKLTGGLEQTLQQNPQLRDVIAKAAQRQWDIRERFLRHQYSSLLLQHAHADPLTLGSETVYLLFLSAAKAANTEAYDRWAQELKRRFPSTEVSAWICESRPHA